MLMLIGYLVAAASRLEVVNRSGLLDFDPKECWTA